MVCACSSIVNITNNNSLIPLIQQHSHRSEIINFRKFIENHPNKEMPSFKKSMVTILIHLLKTLK